MGGATNGFVRRAGFRSGFKPCTVSSISALRSVLHNRALLATKCTRGLIQRHFGLRMTRELAGFGTKTFVALALSF